ncbi:GAP family protein [Leucobacter sp. L43]|uniref:GAP family protein n=1 Tax=Leucobacter sp. L43 TaxID=2798040 RepID=UPI001F27C089|nr:GAP family protein [Leucobacter sp. L43]
MAELVSSVIGELLPLAVGVAISPVPIIAVILMLFASRTTAAGLFLAGWLIGVIAIAAIFTVIGAFLPRSTLGEVHPIVGVIKFVLGVLLLYLATRSWRRHAPDPKDPHMPKWLDAIDSIPARRSFALGFLLAAANPKNLLLGIGAGTSIGAENLTVGDQALAIVAYTLIAGSTVLIPVLVHLTAANRATPQLATARTWLTQNNATIMAVLLLINGVTLIGKGIANL